MANPLLATVATTAALLTTIPARADDGAPPSRAAGGERVVHRRAAGAPDATGWYRARSTHGLFSVDLPGKFNDLSSISSVREKAPLPQRTHTVSASTANGVTFMATAFVRDDGAVPPPGALGEEFFGSAGGRSRPITHAGLRGVEGNLNFGALRVLVRSLAGTDRWFMLQVHYPAAVAESAEAQAKRFFESFRVEEPGSNGPSEARDP